MHQKLGLLDELIVQQEENQIKQRNNLFKLQDLKRKNYMMQFDKWKGDIKI